MKIGETFRPSALEGEILGGPSSRSFAIRPETCRWIRRGTPVRVRDDGDPRWFFLAANRRKESFLGIRDPSNGKGSQLGGLAVCCECRPDCRVVDSRVLAVDRLKPFENRRSHKKNLVPHLSGERRLLRDVLPLPTHLVHAFVQLDRVVLLVEQIARPGHAQVTACRRGRRTGRRPGMRLMGVSRRHTEGKDHPAWNDGRCGEGYGITLDQENVTLPVHLRGHGLLPWGTGIRLVRRKISGISGAQKTHTALEPTAKLRGYSGTFDFKSVALRIGPTAVSSG